MAVSTNSVARVAGRDMSAEGQRALSEFLTQQYAFLAALAAQIDTDAGAGTVYADLLADYLTE